MANDYVGWGLILGIEDGLDEFIDDATEVVNSLGTGIPPRDLAAFSSESTEDGIKLTFAPPGATYLPEHTASDGKQFACMPAGVLIRYSDTGYPRTPDEGKFGYDYKPTGDWVTASQECTIVGLTKNTKYYFTAFPYSTEHVYNKNQVTANRTEMTWVGNKGTISVTVKTPEGYEGTLGEYTITLVAQEDGYENVVESANGKGVTVFENLIDGRKYKVRLGETPNFLPPADSDVVTVVGGSNVDVDMTYAAGVGSVTVNVSTQPANMPIGTVTISLVPQSGGSTLSQQRSGSGSVTFNNVPVGTYTVTGSEVNHYTFSGGSVSVTGGQNTSHNVHYAFNNEPLENFTWAEIDAIGQSGFASSVFSIGDTKNISVSGETLTMEIVGFNHDDLTSGGKAPYTFGMKNLMASTRAMNSSNTNSGSFVGSAMYTGYLSTSFLTGLPSDLQSVIKTVNKKTGTGGGSSSGTRTDAVKIFLFAEIEVFGSITNSVSGEGSRYSRFTNSSSRIKYRSNGSGSAIWWWLRSPSSGNSSNFCGVSSNGNANWLNAYGSNGVCAGFCV